MIRLSACRKHYTLDQDKVLAPAETVARVKALLADKGPGILGEVRRIDTGRLGIPVYMSMYGPRACEIVPFRKQMGKGASPEQAEASALMELVERYSFFHFFADPANFETRSWSAAEREFGERLLPIGDMLASVGENLDPAAARSILDLVGWRFAPALRVGDAAEVVLPADWVKILNEYNGSSAGNTPEESVFQGACELVERHVSALIDRDRPMLPTIDPASCADPVLAGLLGCFAASGVQVVMKDASLSLPVPTVIAVAYDPATFPETSEIVLTAGTASSPAKAAIRALTEVAQLAGDFHTGACYEPSGLSKPESLEEIDWLVRGPEVPLASLPGVADPDILAELRRLCAGLAARGFTLYTLDTRRPELDVPTNYSFVPGFAFRERSPHASLGLFVGRRLAEEAGLEEGMRGLSAIAKVCPGAHYLPFFEGLLTLRHGDPALAFLKFEAAAARQPDAADTALAAFYAAYALTQDGRFEAAKPWLDKAIGLERGAKEYHNLRGVCLFKAGEYAAAAEDFRAALKLDKGSVMDLANLGLCLKFLGRAEEAIEHLSAALSLDPGLDFAARHLEELVAAGTPRPGLATVTQKK
jgi:ribosomal protein S12 methylthiotransferase accessory factor